MSAQHTMNTTCPKPVCSVIAGARMLPTRSINHHSQSQPDSMPAQIEHLLIAIQPNTRYPEKTDAWLAAIFWKDTTGHCCYVWLTGGYAEACQTRNNRPTAVGPVCYAAGFWPAIQTIFNLHTAARIAQAVRQLQLLLQRCCCRCH